MSDTVEEMSEEQIRADLDKGLEEARQLVRGQQVTLPELLGEPQEYEAVPNLYIVRPKLGHKLDLLRKYTAITTNGFTTDEAARLLSDAFAPYAREKQADGSLAKVSSERLLYAFFEDSDEFTDFALRVLNGKKVEDDDAGESPNAEARTPP